MDDERTSLAVERLLENVGEAARHVSLEVQRLHPEIPWQGIIGLRNVLAHQYGVVDQRKVWQAARDGVAALAPLPGECAAEVEVSRGEMISRFAGKPTGACRR